jgi:hypothetical protein
VQERITEFQHTHDDNSGSSLISLLITDDLVLAASAGCGQVLCQTKSGTLLKLSTPHTTNNQTEVNRVTKAGDSVYQTTVSVVNQEYLRLEGPLRLVSSGLSLTRCLGRTCAYNKQQETVDCIGLTYRPEIEHIRIDDVQWVGIFSQTVINNISQRDIGELVSKEIGRASDSLTFHDIACQISHKIVNNLCGEGVAEAMTAIIIIFTVPIRSY